MITKQEFKKAIKNEFLAREETAILYNTGDPRLMQILESQATMLEMVSQQIDLSMAEPFIKAREATVLADAANKGLIFTAKPCTVKLNVENKGDSNINISAGRHLLDAIGRDFITLAPVNITPHSSGFLDAIQISKVVQSHTVSATKPFYGVPITLSDDGSSIYQIQVRVNGELFSPSYKFNNVLVGDKVFHIESDEFKRLNLKFGSKNVIGVQPQNGDVVDITKVMTFGDINLEAGSDFSFRYIDNDSDNDIKLSLASITKVGTSPVDLATLRELVKYPSIYNENAVYLGEFDLLLRSKFPHLAFLNVWNEAKEEQVRGPNVKNINTLFVSFSLPEEMTIDKSAVETQIKEVIHRADSSYRIKFVDPIIYKIPCTISATISRMYGQKEVQKQIIDCILKSFGKEAFSSRQGRVSIKNKDIADLIRQNVQAISDVRGDFFVQLADTSSSVPEKFSYISEDSIDIKLDYNSYDNDVWGA